MPETPSTVIAQQPQLSPTFVGLDIGKEKLDYFISQTEEGSFANTVKERAKWIKTLQQLPRPRVICEASGGYEKQIVAELLAAKIEVCLVQPGRVRAFANAEGLLAKNDRLDARLLWRFGQKVEPRLLEPTPASVTVSGDANVHRSW